MERRRPWLVVLMLAWGLGAWAAAGPTEAPDDGWLKIQKPRPEKPPVRFSHKRHPKTAIACEQCHHDYQKGRNVWREGQPAPKCQECHKLLAKRGLIDIQEAFHRQCKGCHLAKRKVRQKAGPIQCEGCHTR